MRVRFLVSIASATWSYAPQQEVTVGGEEFTTEAIPDAIAEAWLAAGHVEPLLDDLTVETATRPRGRRK